MFKFLIQNNRPPSQNWNKVILLMLLPLLCTFSSMGQGIMENKITVKYVKYTDGIVFKLFPNDYNQWKQLSTKGWKIERFTIAKDGQNIPLQYAMLSPGPILPLEKSQWSNIKDTLPEAALYFDCLYRTHLDSNNKTIPSLVQTTQENNECFAYAMMAAINKPEISFYGGLKFADMSAIKGENYLYRILAPNKNQTDTISILIDFSSPSAFPALNKLIVKQENKNVLINWEENAEYYGLTIEKSTDGGNTFKKINEKPIVLGTKINGNLANFLVDTNLNYEKPIVYRSIGIGFLGDPSPASDTTEIICHENNEAYATNLTYSKVNKNVILSWDFPILNEKLLQGFKVMYAPHLDSIMTPLHTGFLDSKTRNINILNGAYYKIEAWDKSGNLTSSLPLLVVFDDSIAPLSPIIKTSFLDSNNHIHLSWNHNVEKDFYGYKIYRGNFRNSEFSVITPNFFSDTFYIDSLDLSLHRDTIYYYITAADIRYNESISNIIHSIALPDLRKPETPSIFQTVLHKSAIELQWTKPNRKVNYFRITRLNTDNKSETKTILIEDPFSTNFLDTNIHSNTNYQYSIEAIGLNGSTSHPSPLVQIKSMPETVLPKLEFSAIVQDTLNNKIIFYWRKNTYSNITHYRIMEYTNQGQSRTIGTAKADESTFTWRTRPKYHLQKYSIMFYLSDGRRSTP